MVEQNNDSHIAARLSRSNEGGPIRTILNGRKRGRSGTFVSFKADLRAMPWESIKGELPLLQVSEVSSGVSQLLSQPHRLKIKTPGLQRSLVYFPDIEISVDHQFLMRLYDEMPFAEAASEPRTVVVGRAAEHRVVIEVKVEGDPRENDERYLEKLRLAEQVYRRIGYHFFVVRRERDFPADHLERFVHLCGRRHTSVTFADVDRVRQLFLRNTTCPYQTVVSALGGGNVGPAKAAAMHVRRLISIDLRQPITKKSNVFLMVASCPK